MKRWIYVLSALVLLQSGVIVKQARTILKSDAKLKAIEARVYVCPGGAEAFYNLQPIPPLPPGYTLDRKP